MKKRRASILRRVVRTALLLGALLFVAGVVFLSTQPRLDPGDLLAPFRGDGGAMTKDGLVESFCRTAVDCRDREHPPGWGRWTCRLRSCVWRPGGVGQCDLRKRGWGCPRDAVCDMSGCDAQWGRCVDAPAACPRGGKPVCGCPRRDFANDCERLLAGVALRAASPCDELCYEPGERFQLPRSPLRRLVATQRPCCDQRRVFAVPLHVPRDDHPHCVHEDAEPTLDWFVCRVCGDDRCDPGETHAVCPRDCPAGPQGSRKKNFPAPRASRRPAGKART